MNLSTKRIGLGLLIATGALGGLTTAVAADPPAGATARCEQRIIGTGDKDWRRDHLDAGPLGVRKHPLQTFVQENRPGRFVTKMPVLVEGQTRVTLAAPPALRHRVLLGYGWTRNGQAQYSSVVSFEPCFDKPRTIWAGGIRVKGRTPVRLLVTVEGDPTVHVMHLGRPKPMRITGRTMSGWVVK